VNILDFNSSTTTLTIAFLISRTSNKPQVNQYQQQPVVAKHIKDEEKNAKNMFKKSFTISDEFMKWCHEQLKDFNADCKFPITSDIKQFGFIPQLLCFF
jgi:hypothetical protein